MIQLNDCSICVEMNDGSQVPLMARSVVRAFCADPSQNLGLEPWQVEQIAEALIYYLRVDLKRETIGLGEFLKALSTLTTIFTATPAQFQSDLVRSADLYSLAQTTGYGFELGFFRSVEGLIHDVRHTNARLVQFVNLRACVKLIVGARSWGRSCQRLSDDIVGFIRSHMMRRAGNGPIAFAVS